MLPQRIAVACALVLALSGCTTQRATGSGGLQTASTAPIPTGPTQVGATSSVGTTPTPETATATTHKTSTHAPKPAGSTTPPQPADFGIGWSNAECQWFLTSSGQGDARMTANVSATAPNTAQIILTVTSNGGGVPTATSYYPAGHLQTGDNRYVADIIAPAADLESHTITFTGTLTFNGQSDDLSTDNSASLAVTFPAAFQAATGENIENLYCTHVRN